MSPMEMFHQLSTAGAPRPPASSFLKAVGTRSHAIVDEMSRVIKSKPDQHFIVNSRQQVIVMSAFSQCNYAALLVLEMRSCLVNVRNVGRVRIFHDPGMGKKSPDSSSTSNPFRKTT
jgi:hypothetical protein